MFPRLSRRTSFILNLSECDYCNKKGDVHLPRMFIDFTSIFTDGGPSHYCRPIERCCRTMLLTFCCSGERTRSANTFRSSQQLPVYLVSLKQRLEDQERSNRLIFERYAHTTRYFHILIRTHLNQSNMILTNLVATIILNVKKHARHRLQSGMFKHQGVVCRDAVRGGSQRSLRPVSEKVKKWVQAVRIAIPIDPIFGRHTKSARNKLSRSSHSFPKGK
ncbi:unnamed protein product, partial [Nesidiocoris tenuis]